MLSRHQHDGGRSERVALKDERLIYRACSKAFAHSVGCASPDAVIGKTDFDLFPGDMAREQMALDSQAIFTAKADISAIDLSSTRKDSRFDQCFSDQDTPTQAMIVRTPVIAGNNYVRGIDIRLLSGPVVNAPKSAVAIDYQTLVNDGIQGSLIISRHSILFANDNAARVMGYPSAQALIDHGRVAKLFNEQQHQKALDNAVADLSAVADPTRNRVTLMARTRTGSQVRLIARVTYVQWGASRALMLSFVDVALPDEPGRAVTPHAKSRELQLSPLTSEQLDRWRVVRSNEQRYRHYASAAADFFWEIDGQLVFRVVMTMSGHRIYSRSAISNRFAISSSAGRSMVTSGLFATVAFRCLTQREPLSGTEVWDVMLPHRCGSLSRPPITLTTIH